MKERRVLLATVFLLFAGSFFITRAARADLLLKCTKENVGCAGNGCVNYFGSYSCGELTNVVFYTCEPGTVPCPMMLKRCATVNYYRGGPCTGTPPLCTGRGDGVANTGEVTNPGCTPP